MDVTREGGKAFMTRQKILNAAETLFTSKGYDAVSVDEICESISLTKGAFYYHFKNKEEILAHLFIPRLDNHLENHYAWPEEKSAREYIVNLARATLECARIVGRSVIARSSAGMLSGQHVLLYYTDRIHTKILKEAWECSKKTIDFHSFSLLYSSVMTGILLNWAAEPPASATSWDNIISLSMGQIFADI